MPYDFDQVINRRDAGSQKWRKYPGDVLPLWVADMDFRSPEPVLDALSESVDHGVFGYAVEPEELREVIVARLEQLYGWRVPPEALVFLPGVVIGINLVCQALSSAGDGVLVQTPAYPPFLHTPANAHCTCDEMELTIGPDGQYGIDPDRFEGAITDRTRVFVLCNPHKPVGRVFTQDELERMAEMCLRHDLVICSDEIHCDFVYPGTRHIPIASLDPEVGKRTITLMAPSKTYNIAGLKFALAIIANAELRERFEAAKRGLVRHPDILAYVAALAAYREGQGWLDEALRYLDANRDFTCQYVRDQLPNVSVAKPEATYLAWLDCRRAHIPNSPQRFFLEKAKVALTDGVDCGRGGEGFVRLNLGCPRTTLVEALQRMRRALIDLNTGEQGVLRRD